MLQGEGDQIDQIPGGGGGGGVSGLVTSLVTGCRERVGWSNL